jgi:ADP-ribose pyrophosphatase
LSAGRDIVAIDVVADRTAGARPDEGFLRMRRLTVQNRYADGSHSAPYPCDVVSRTRVDAVAIVLYEVTGERRVRVAMRTGVRPPVSLRADKNLVQPDERPFLLLTEIVAGLLEPEDTGADGPDRRAAAECREEAGYDIAPADVRRLGAPLFASPGTSDERVHYRAASADLEAAGEPTGDGSVMEEAGEVVVYDLDEAIAMCRRGEIPDSKTEIGLLRLCDHLGYLPQLRRFADDLPAALRPSDGHMARLRGEGGPP